jgi:3-oxoadipate enol-lactonase
MEFLMRVIVSSDGCPIHLSMAGPATAPVLIMSHPLGADLSIWERQIEPLSRYFRLLRYDSRGHGRSGAPASPYTMARLGRDVLDVMDALELETANWCGVSLGGMVGQWLGAHAPRRFRRMIFSNTSCYYPDKKSWDDRIEAVKADGTSAVVGSVPSRWFTPAFVDHEAATVKSLQDVLMSMATEGYMGCCEAIKSMDHRDIIGGITAPVLVIAGEHDVATPLAHSEYIHCHIRGSKLVMLKAGHISNLERPAEFSEQVLKFLQPVEA